MVYFLINISILFLPIAIYLILLCYYTNYKEKNKNYLAVILIIEVILMIIFKDYSKSIILINIPLLIAYLKRYELTSLILTILIGFYYVIVLEYNPYFIFFEYSLYYIVFLIFTKRVLKVNALIYIFMFVKSITLTIEIVYFNLNNYPFLNNFLDVLIKMLVFYGSSYLVFNFLLKGEEMMNLNTAIRELEKEKVLRTSLFKLTHEIKNPIAVCKGYLDMLDLNDKNKVLKYIPIVKGEIERTLTLMDDYLEYTKLSISKEEVDIYMLLEEVMDSLELFFKENKIKLEFNLPDDELYLDIDYNRIKQVMVNMLKNAHEALDKNKKEMIIKIDTKVLKKYFQIIIEDNGIGMDLETLNNVGNLFFTTKRNGTGLGTSLSKEIIELHGGKIKYYSKVGEGTKVVISLPL